MDVRYKVADSVATVTLARPAKRNALTIDIRIRLIDGFAQAAADRAVRAVLLNAEGPGFCAGADVGGMGDLTLPGA